MSETAAVVMGNQGNDTPNASTPVAPAQTAQPAPAPAFAPVQGASNVDTQKIEQMLQQIIKTNKKQVRWARTAALFMILLFLVIGGAIFVLVPQLTDTLSNINTAVAQANDLLNQAEDSLKDINDMTVSLTDTSNQINSVLSENSEALASAISQIEAIDFEGLNNAIAELETTISPFANFMSRFNR